LIEYRDSADQRRLAVTTELKRFEEAYATLTFAVYEPLILRWYSGLTVAAIANSYVKRSHVATTKARSAMAISEEISRFRAFPEAEGSIEAHDHVNAATEGMDREELFVANPGLELTARTAFVGGRMNRFPIGPELDGRDPVRDEAPPLVFATGAQPGVSLFDTRKVTEEIVRGYDEELRKLIKNAPGGVIPGSELKKMLLENAKSKLELYDASLDDFELLAPTGEWLEFLSPIGIAHFYRQLYFYVTEGVGPVEQAFTVAPRETLEVVTETVRRQSHEEVFEQGSEAVSETAVESRNVDEVSDKVASMVQRDSSMAVSANTSFEGGGNIGVWNISGSAGMGLNTSMADSSQSSTEIAKRRVKEITKRASERITKTFSLRVRDTVDFTTTNVQRRVISNKTEKPTSYGLRRVFNRVRVKVQSLGPNLVWQLYVSSPGDGLARSRYVQFAEAQQVARPSEPPAIRPKPTGGVERGTVSSQLKRDTTKAVTDPMAYYVTLKVQVASDQEVVAVSIESVTDLEHLGKTDYAPSPSGGSRPGSLQGGVYTIELGVLPGDAESVSVTYQYTWQPSKATMDTWEAERDAALKDFAKQEAAEREKALREQFERQRSLITERSKVRPRAAADLRKEERYEVLNRMVSHLFKPKGKGSPGAPSPLEIELFHRYFDIEAMFVTLHPSWWVPRYASNASGFDRPEYEITAESEPAALGRSLGWTIQLDGDSRRNEFINSPWVRVCLPIRPGRETEAVDWLAEHVEGDTGYNKNAQPLKGLLTEMNDLRKNQAKVVGTGPDYVDAKTAVVAATTGAPAGPLKPENVYPVVDEFEVTVPSEGFVYDDLVVKIP
jgi:hypothetical protein